MSDGDPTLFGGVFGGDPILFKGMFGAGDPKLLKASFEVTESRGRFGATDPTLFIGSPEIGEPVLSSGRFGLGGAIFLSGRPRVSGLGLFNKGSEVGNPTLGIGMPEPLEPMLGKDGTTLFAAGGFPICPKTPGMSRRAVDTDGSEPGMLSGSVAVTV